MTKIKYTIDSAVSLIDGRDNTLYKVPLIYGRI